MWRNLISLTLFRQAFATFVMNHGALLSGLSMSYPSCLLTQLSREKYLKETFAESILGSISALAFGGSTFASVLFIGRTSRRKLTQLSLVIYGVGTLFVIFATNIVLLCVGLVIQSSVVSCLGSIAITYVSEVSKKEYRGTFLASIFVSITFGLSLNYILNSLVTWRTMAIIMLLITASGFIGTFFIPESNFWYLLQGDKEAAKKSIKWFESTRTNEELDKRVDNILTLSEIGNVKKYNLDFIRDLRHKKFYKPFLIALLITFFRGGNGRLVLGVYLETFFKDMSTPYSISSLISWFGWADLIGSFVILFFMHKIKRKTVVIVATLIMVLSLSTTTIYLFTKDTYNFIPPWLAVSTLYSYAMCVMTAYNSVITIIISEMQPPTYRPQINLFQNGVLFVVYSLNTFIFPYAANVIHIRYILIYFISSITACSLIVLTFAPETSQMEFYENKKKPTSNSSISTKL